MLQALALIAKVNRYNQRARTFKSMLSKSQIKLISSLKLKKERYEQRLFTIEGEKPVKELLESAWPVQLIVVRIDWYEREHPTWLQSTNTPIELVSATDMERLTQLHSASPIMAVAPLQQLEWNWHKGQEGFVMVLDRIADPGNLGTLLRIADWFGFSGVLCSSDTVDLFNAKTIQASMGSAFRMPVLYGDLLEWVAKEDMNRIFAASMTGQPVNKQSFGTGGLLLIGSEAHGLDPVLAAMAGHHVHIPGFGKAESLNAAVAAGIMASWVRLGQG